MIPIYSVGKPSSWKKDGLGLILDCLVADDLRIKPVDDFHHLHTFQRSSRASNVVPEAVAVTRTSTPLLRLLLDPRGAEEEEEAGSSGRQCQTTTKTGVQTRRS